MGMSFSNEIFFSVNVIGDTPISFTPACRYGHSCYRKNPNHFVAFSHPQTSTYIKLTNDEPSFSALDLSIRSMYDCRYHDFTIINEFDEIIDSDESLIETIYEYSPKQLKNPISLTIEFKSSKWQSKRTCSNCWLDTSKHDFIYYCKTCCKVICSTCESSRVHSCNHIISKVYHDQENLIFGIPFKPSFPSFSTYNQVPFNPISPFSFKNELISYNCKNCGLYGHNSSSSASCPLRIVQNDIPQPKIVKKEEQVKAKEQEEVKEEKQNNIKDILFQVKNMGFKITMDVVKIANKYPNDISAIVAELIELDN